MNDIKPAQLLLEHLGVLLDTKLPGPVLDLACGDGSNGTFLAKEGFEVTCCDKSEQALQQASRIAQGHGATVKLWQVDLEREGVNPLPRDTYGAILVFRYLHRPLMPCIRKALRNGGLLLYETFTVAQPRFGRPHNPNFLLDPEELLQVFQDWHVIHYFEGIREDPVRAVAQIVCRKRSGDRKQ